MRLQAAPPSLVLFLVLLLRIWRIQSHAHHRHIGCGTTDPEDFDRLSMNLAVKDYYDVHGDDAADRDLTASRYHVPMFVHNFIPNDQMKLSMEQVQHFADALNDAYAKSPFTFYIEQLDNIVSQTLYNCNMSDQSWKQPYHVPYSNALNVYFCDSYRFDWQSIHGQSTFPTQATSSLDGIVIMTPETFGANASIWTTPHEVGHWLGLLHTFAFGCSPHSHTVVGMPLHDGDSISDTPAHANATWLETEIKFCYIGQGLNTCDDSIPGIDHGLDPVQNMMNYLDPECFMMAAFTPDQIKRAKALFNQYRLVNPYPRRGGGGGGGGSCKRRGQVCTLWSRCCKGFECLQRKAQGKRKCRRTCGARSHKCRSDSDCCLPLTCSNVLTLGVSGKYCQ